MLNNKKIIALLPMKANSERVKGKNFRIFGDKPLFKWILDSLLELEYIDKVVINTDARGILLENGLVESDRVVIRDRKDELCGDFVDMNKILNDDIQNTNGDLYLMTHTTNPLLGSQTIGSAIDKLLSAGESVDSLFTVNKIQTRFYREDMSAVNHDPKNLIRTQDLEPWFEENSCLYLFSKESFKATGTRIGKSPIMFTTPALESVDIDNPDDWTMAEALANNKARG